MEYLKKKHRHLKFKIVHKFHHWLFGFFILLAIWSSFLPISPIQSCQKILYIFVVLYCMDYRFYHRILEISWIFIKKIDILKIQNIFRIRSFTICFFNFLVFLTSFFLFYLSMVSEKIVKFLCCFIVWIRDFIKKIFFLYTCQKMLEIFMFFFIFYGLEILLKNFRRS